MKSRTSFLLAPALAIGMAGTSFGAVYFTNFSGYNIGDINGQNGWSVSDPTLDAGYIINAGGVWGSRSATLGFVAPVQSNSVFLSRAVDSTPLVGTSNATFSTLFQVIDSDSVYGGGAEVRDTFGFRLENSSGDNLFSFFLNPFSQSDTPEDSTAFHTFAWSTGTGTQTIAIPGLAAEEFFAYTFTVSFYNAGNGDVGFNASVNSETFGGVLEGLESESIARLGAFWNLTEDAPDGNGDYYGGSNFLLFDEVTLIPEPSSALLVCLAGVGFIARRKRIFPRVCDSSTKINSRTIR